MSTQTRARKLTVTAMLSTIAFILMYIEFPIPALIPSFVKLDISDLPELLAAFSLGPVYGVVVSLLKNVLFSLLHGTSSAYVGETFNFIMGAVFSFSAGFIYKKYKSRKGALTGALVGAVLMSVLSVPLNYFIVYPAYVKLYDLPLEAIMACINPFALQPTDFWNACLFSTCRSLSSKGCWMLHCASSFTSRFRLCCINKGGKKAGGRANP